MPVKYSKSQEALGVSIGTIMQVPKPSTWNNSGNINTEGNNWNIENLFPGWLPCDGRTVDKDDYPALYNVIGDVYGSTTTTFNLPDYRSVKLKGTGFIDGNIGSGASVVVNAGPGNSGSQPDLALAGSTGGQFIIDTVRQLPPNSEITPGDQSSPRIYYDVADTFLTSTEVLTGVARIPYEDGNDQPGGTGEVGGFSEPFVANNGQYLAFGTYNLSPFNTLQTTRSAQYTVDLTGYTRIFLYIISGNDSNGGERPNTPGNPGDDLRLYWPDGSFETIVPATGNTTLTFDEWDNEYSGWTELAFDIPVQYQTTGVTFRIESIITVGGEMGATLSAANPNAFDAYGIQRIGFEGGTFGGVADDTFEIGGYNTLGWDSITGIVDVELAGNAFWSASDVDDVIVSRPPPHDHQANFIEATGGEGPEAASGDPACCGRSVGAYNNQSASGGVNPFDRGGATIRRHSHKLFWDSTDGTLPLGTFGNDNSDGGTSYNDVFAGGTATYSQSYSDTNNRGPTINMTKDIVNELGMSVNPATLTLRNSNIQTWDNSLDVRLQAAEKLSLMSPYFRLKYMIKAY